MSALVALLARLAGGSWLWIAAGAVAVSLATALGVQTARLDHANELLAKKDAAAAVREAQWSAESASAVAAAASEAAQYRALEQQRATEREGIIHDTTQKLAAAQSAAVAASSAAERLQRRFSALVATAAAPACQAASDPANAAGVAAAASAARMSSDVFGRIESLAQLYSLEADKRGIRGSNCERERDTLTTR